MNKVKRKIISIDEKRCNGCGQCVSACAEGAIQIVGGKAVLVKDIYCDGLGACIGECPRGAIKIEEREAEPFNEEATKVHLSNRKEPDEAKRPSSFKCPGLASFSIKREAARATQEEKEEPDSELSQWPVQLHLVPPNAPYWDGANVLITADCVPIAFAGFHSRLLRGRKVITACPKLDDTSGYLEKLTAIFEFNNIKSVRVAHMEVPCCSGIVKLVAAALENCGKDIPLETIKIGINGKILSETGGEKWNIPQMGKAAV